MPDRKPQPPRNADDPDQSRRFIDTARKLEAEEPAEDADAILRALAQKERKPVTPTARRSRKRAAS